MHNERIRDTFSTIPNKQKNIPSPLKGLGGIVRLQTAFLWAGDIRAADRISLLATVPCDENSLDLVSDRYTVG
jgi:hypothetical protein